MLPSEISSRPATMRRVVDLPQPEGPTNTINSLSLISRFASLTAMTLPNRLVTFCQQNPGHESSPPLFVINCHPVQANTRFPNGYSRSPITSTVFSRYPSLRRESGRRCFIIRRKVPIQGLDTHQNADFELLAHQGQKFPLGRLIRHHSLHVSPARLFHGPPALFDAFLRCDAQSLLLDPDFIFQRGQIQSTSANRTWSASQARLLKRRSTSASTLARAVSNARSARSRLSSASRRWMSEAPPSARS